MRVPRPIAARPVTRRPATSGPVGHSPAGHGPAGHGPAGRRLVAILATAVATALASLIPSASVANAAVTKVATTVQIKCASTTMNAAANWYFPTGTPTGLVWLQHGFFRGKDNMGDLAEAYADAGHLVFAPTLPSSNSSGCTVQNGGDNTGFLANVANLFGDSQNSAGNLAVSFANAKATAGRPELSLPANMVFSGHSAGGDAAAYVAGYVKQNYPAAASRLRGLILLDPVKSNSGSNLATGLTALNTAGTPVKTISAPDGSCNSNGTGTDEVQARIHRSFVGVRLVTGKHTDAEGTTSDFLGRLTCGTPQAANIAILQTLSVNWAKDAFAGTTTATYYPGGTYYQNLLTTNKIETLAGAS